MTAKVHKKPRGRPRKYPKHGNFLPCVICGKPLVVGRRTQSMYCRGKNCKDTAYRIRERLKIHGILWVKDPETVEKNKKKKLKAITAERGDYKPSKPRVKRRKPWEIL